MGTKFRLTYPNEDAELCTKLALRTKNGSGAGRGKGEFLPDRLDTEDIFSFVKEGQRVYPLHEDIPLVETQGDGKISDPIAMVRIVETPIHYRKNGKIYTSGRYEVVECLYKQMRNPSS